MRIYLPATLSRLRSAQQEESIPVLSGVGFAVTEPLRLEYPDWAEEDLEYLAMQDASRASLRLLAAAGPDEPMLRVVIATDVAAESVTPRPEADRAVVAVPRTVDWSQVAAVHIDGADAGSAVAEAAAVIDAADLGDHDAEFTLGSAEDFDLAWYAPGEVSYLFDELDAGPG
ncbi:MAG: hypothetical protein ABJD68_19185 [Nakamurella sp.]